MFCMMSVYILLSFVFSGVTLGSREAFRFLEEKPPEMVKVRKIVGQEGEVMAMGWASFAGSRKRVSGES